MENTVHPSSTNEDPEEPVSAARRRGGWRAIKYILGNESFEKVASMSLVANMTVYLRTKYNMEGIMLVNVVTIWFGSSNIASLAGAFVSDTYLGRYFTLIVGSVASLLKEVEDLQIEFPLGQIYCKILNIYQYKLVMITMNWNKGMAIMTLTAGLPQLHPSNCTLGSDCQQPQPWQLGFLYAALTFLVIGSGCIRPCNIAFGADQFDTTTDKGRAQLESFFNWWYFSFTIALIIALTGVIYVQTEVSWFLGFLIPTLCLCLSLAIFLLGRNIYIRNKPQGSVFTDVVKVITASCRKRTQKIEPNSVFYDSEERDRHLGRTSRFRCLDKAALVINLNELNDAGEAKSGWKLCSVQQVERLKCILGTVPVWISGIACFMSMDQQATFGILQSIQMNQSVGAHFEVPPSWVSLVPMIALAIWIVVYEGISVPLTKTITGHPKRLTMRQRINIGIIMSVLCMVASGIVEKKRRNSALRHHTFTSPMSFVWLLPQFIFSGLTEAFASVGVMEYLSTQMPESMRTVAGAIFFLSMSISSYVGSFLVNVIHGLTGKNGGHPWLGGHDLNKNRLEYYYYIVAGIGGINFVYFNCLASKYLELTSRWCDDGEQKTNLFSKGQYLSKLKVEEEGEELVSINS